MQYAVDVQSTGGTVRLAETPLGAGYTLARIRQHVIAFSPRYQGTLAKSTTFRSVSNEITLSQLDPLCSTPRAYSHRSLSDRSPFFSL